MKNILLAACLLTAGQTMAADGTAALDFGSFNASYEVELNANQLTGHQVNLGAGSGKVEMGREDGTWEGNFGFTRIATGAVQAKSENKLNLDIFTFPGGTYRAYVEHKSDRSIVRLTTPYGAFSTATIKFGKYIRGSNSNIGVDLKKGDGQVWAGRTVVSSRNYMDSADTALTVRDSLNPETLIKVDPALFIILYVLPYNYVR